jgi:hypothetical protein
MKIPALACRVSLLALVACSRREPPAMVVDAAPPPPDLAPAGAGPPPDAAAPPDVAPDTAPAAKAGGKKKAAASAEEGATGPALAAMGKVTVAGDLPRADVERILKGRAGAFRSCYERELGQHPTLKGRVLLELTVAPTGSVALAEVKTSTLGGGDAEMCVGQLARDLRFKARPGAPQATVTFPIEFRRGK